MVRRSGHWVPGLWVDRRVDRERGRRGDGECGADGAHPSPHVDVLRALLASRAARHRARGDGGAHRRAPGGDGRSAGLLAGGYGTPSSASRPDAVGFGINCLANASDVIGLAKAVKARRPHGLVFAGAHSGLFIAERVLDEADEAIDGILRGESELAAPAMLAGAYDHASRGARRRHLRWGSVRRPRQPSISTKCCQRATQPPSPSRFLGVLDAAASFEDSRGRL